MRTLLGRCLLAATALFAMVLVVRAGSHRLHSLATLVGRVHRLAPGHSLLDFGRVAEFHDSGHRYRWTPVECSVERGKPAYFESQNRVQFLPLLINPMVPVRVTCPASGRKCDRRTVLAKVRENTGRLYRFTFGLWEEREGRCENDYVAWNEGALSEVSFFELTRTATEQAPVAETTSPATAPKAIFSWNNPDQWALASVLREIPALAKAPNDFRIAKYLFDELGGSAALLDVVRNAGQSLVLTSSVMLNSGQDRAVARLLDDDPEFPLYFVLRSPMAYPDRYQRFVMHLKAFTFDHQVGEFSSAVAPTSPVLPLDLAVRFTDQAHVKRLSSILLAVLDRDAEIPAATEGILYHRAEAVRGEAERGHVAEEPTNAAVLDLVRSAQDSLLVVGPWYETPEVWKAAAASRASEIVVISNGGADSHPRKAIGKLRDTVSRPGRALHVVGTALGGDDNPNFGGGIHLRAYFVDDDRCIVSDSSLSALGGTYSDSLNWITHDKKFCSDLRQNLAQLLQDRGPSGTGWTMFNGAAFASYASLEKRRAQGLADALPSLRVFDATDGRKLLGAELASTLARIRGTSAATDRQEQR